jgi:hypothetical protein
MNTKPKLELSLPELLDEPMIQVLMARDGVERADVELMFRALRETRPEPALNAEAILAKGYW